jgi:hypothetical protein
LISSPMQISNRIGVVQAKITSVLRLSVAAKKLR